MKTTALRVLLCATSILLAAVLNGCIIPSVYEIDRSAGPNDSFEIVESGLPVNWFFSRRSIRNGSAEISIDTTDAVEGKQSLKVIAHRIEPPGGGLEQTWLFTSRSAAPGVSYKVSFWLKNQGCIIGLEIGNEGKDPVFGPSEAVKQDLAAHPPITKTLGKSRRAPMYGADSNTPTPFRRRMAASDLI